MMIIEIYAKRVGTSAGLRHTNGRLAKHKEPARTNWKLKLATLHLTSERSLFGG